MSKTKYILGLFDDPDVMMHGIDKLQKNSIPIYDVYTPMPIHGIDEKLGLRFTLRLCRLYVWLPGRHNYIQHGLLYACARLADEHRW